MAAVIAAATSLTGGKVGRPLQVDIVDRFRRRLVAGWNPRRS